MSVLKQPVMRPLALRLDPGVKKCLEDLAQSSQRQVSQLIRHALEEYLSLEKIQARKKNKGIPDNPSAPVESANLTGESEMKMLSVRLSEDLQVSLEGYARANGETISEVARKAIISWIPTADLEKLGSLGGSK